MATMTESPAQGSGAVRARFVATIFTGSFLLFLVQPMIARMAAVIAAPARPVVTTIAGEIPPVTA